MTINRYEIYSGMNENDILAKYGYMDIDPLLLQPYYKVNNYVVFLFVDVEEEYEYFSWIEKPDVFSMKVYESMMYKSCLVDEILGKTILVFIKEKKDYLFYGIYQLDDPHKGVCIEGGVEVYEPLVYRFDAERCDNNGMISF